MAKKGRPFTYQSDDDKPVTISLRIPRELHTRLERYCKQHRQSLSDLVKDGIEMRLETEADPRSRSAGSTPARLQDQEEYYGNTEDSTALLNGASIILREMHEGFAQIRAMVQTLEQQAKPGSNGTYYGNTAMEPEGQERAIEQEPARGTAPRETIPPVAEGILSHNNMPPQGDTILDYDPTRYGLGRLCRNGHSYHGTGQSLRQLSGDHECLTCKRERTQKSRTKAMKATAS